MMGWLRYINVAFVVFYIARQWLNLRGFSTSLQSYSSNLSIVPTTMVNGSSSHSSISGSRDSSLLPPTITFQSVPTSKDNNNAEAEAAAGDGGGGSEDEEERNLESTSSVLHLHDEEEVYVNSEDEEEEDEDEDGEEEQEEEEEDANESPAVSAGAFLKEESELREKEKEETEDMIDEDAWEAAVSEPGTTTTISVPERLEEEGGNSNPTDSPPSPADGDASTQQQQASASATKNPKIAEALQAMRKQLNEQASSLQTLHGSEKQEEEQRDASTTKFSSNGQHSISKTKPSPKDSINPWQEGQAPQQQQEENSIFKIKRPQQPQSTKSSLSLNDKDRTALYSKNNFAYVFYLGGVTSSNNNQHRLGYLYNILVSVQILKESGSTADMIVLVHPAHAEDTLPAKQEQMLQDLGVEIQYTTKMNTVYLDPTIYFAAVPLEKFRIFDWKQYDRIMVLEGDIMPHCNMDYLFHASMDGTIQPNVLFSIGKFPVSPNIFVIKPGSGGLGGVNGGYRDFLQMVSRFPHEPNSKWWRFPRGEWTSLYKKVVEVEGESPKEKKKQKPEKGGKGTTTTRKKKPASTTSGNTKKKKASTKRYTYVTKKTTPPEKPRSLKPKATYSTLKTKPHTTFLRERYENQKTLHTSEGRRRRLLATSTKSTTSSTTKVKRQKTTRRKKRRTTRPKQTKWDFPGHDSDVGLLYVWMRYKVRSLTVIVGNQMYRARGNSLLVGPQPNPLQQYTCQTPGQLRSNSGSKAKLTSQIYHLTKIQATKFLSPPNVGPYRDFAQWQHDLRKPWSMTPQSSATVSVGGDIAVTRWFQVLTKLDETHQWGLGLAKTSSGGSSGGKPPRWQRVTIPPERIVVPSPGLRIPLLEEWAQKQLTQSPTRSTATGNNRRRSLQAADTTKSSSKKKKRAFVCVTGQLERLELDNKLETLFKPILSRGYELDVALVVTGGASVYTNDDQAHNTKTSRPFYANYTAAAEALRLHGIRVLSRDVYTRKKEPPFQDTYYELLRAEQGGYRTAEAQKARAMNHARIFESYERCLAHAHQAVKLMQSTTNDPSLRVENYYNVFMRMRDDVGLQKQLPRPVLTRLLEPSPGSVQVTECRSWYGMNDRFASVAPDVAESYFTQLYKKYLKCVFPKDRVFNPETYLMSTYVEAGIRILVDRELKGIFKVIMTDEGKAAFAPADLEDQKCPGVDLYRERLLELYGWDF